MLSRNNVVDVIVSSLSFGTRQAHQTVFTTVVSFDLYAKYSPVCPGRRLQARGPPSFGFMVSTVCVLDLYEVAGSRGDAIYHVSDAGTWE